MPIDLEASHELAIVLVVSTALQGTAVYSHAVASLEQIGLAAQVYLKALVWPVGEYSEQDLVYQQISVTVVP